jgi:hypothetical protein
VKQARSDRARAQRSDGPRLGHGASTSAIQCRYVLDGAIYVREIRDA